MDWAAGFIQDAKLRFSIGQSGNDRCWRLSFFSLPWTSVSSSITDKALQSPSVEMGNPNVKWETTTSSNWGLEISALNNRVNMTIEYYIKSTHDLLYEFELPKETGKSTVVKNLGDIRNTGWEFTLMTTPISTRNFTWDIGGNISVDERHYRKTGRQLRSYRRPVADP